MSDASVIAVDGPSGSGKGTLSRHLAARLGWHLLDSGALYRLVALVTERQGLEPDDATHLTAVVALARGLQAAFRTDDAGRETILLAGEDVTAALRTERCGDRASRFAAIPEIRAALLELQRCFRCPPGLVADGRDMGTVVFPHAELKIFLTASVEERAHRRLIQLRELGIDANLDKIYAEIRQRDERDRKRAHAPLKPAEDAIVLDTTSLAVEAVITRVVELAKRRRLLS